MTEDTHAHLTKPQDGARILLVEDEMMISMMLESLLESFGHRVVGPASTIENALSIIASNTLDGGILDLNLSGEAVYPVAEKLEAKQIPFLFITGYKIGDIRKDYRNRPMLRKPFRTQDLKQSLRALLS